MKQVLKLFCTLGTALFLLLPTPVYAVGESNLDGGGSGMGSGTSSNSWTPGYDGVRVTVIRASDHAVVTVPIDFSNKIIPSSVYNFGRVSKIQYSNGTALHPIHGGYAYSAPGKALPRIISSSGNNNIDAIKKYFCSEYVLNRISEITGMNYSVLIGGQYKILIEPVAYYKFQGAMIASTATEAALYDEQLNGKLRSKLVSLTHKNLPLSTFLETSDLGYPAWSGSTTKPASDASIISSLGLGIVRFTELPEQQTISGNDYEYRVNTQVITAISISGGQSDPDHPVRVSFTIGGTVYSVGNIYYPADESQLAWVRWTTPSTPQYMNISVNVYGAGSPSKATIHCKIVDLNRNLPPNPVADDRNDNFSQADVPSRPQSTTASWTIWRPWWHANWVWVGDDDDGYWVDMGWWEFDLDRYSAGISGSMRITPDSKDPTASGRTIKSGYGINQAVSGSVSTNQSSAVTGLQNAVSYFPEFDYQTYWRLLDRIGTGQFVFQQNLYSTYRNRTHFTPIWMPDGAYTVNTWLIDCWTPSGMLSLNLTDSLTIQGNLWQDWRVAPKIPQ